MTVHVHPANVQDRDGAKPTMKKRERSYPLLTLVLADGGYQGELIKRVNKELNLDLEIIKRNENVKGFEVLPWRWIVERTLAWLNKNRRMSKDFERLPKTTEAWIYLAMFSLMSRRLCSIENEVNQL